VKPLSPSLLRRLAVHEARAQAHGRRELRDLGDAVVLLDPEDPDPFVNRVVAMRLPVDPTACDRRLAEIYGLFAAAARRPHAWLWPDITTPADLHRRLLADGFADLGGTFEMLLGGRLAPVPLPDGARVERASTAGPHALDVIAAAAGVMAEAFGVVAGSVEAVIAELSRAAAPCWDVCLVTLDDEPVAAGRRYTADGMTHLSSIATRPAFVDRGLGSVVTAALADDGIRAAGPIVHLGVEATNDRAERLYRRLGFERAGERIADLLL
jgi:ribosomal protein S18 acetylase RimI-like enzyme